MADDYFGTADRMQRDSSYLHQDKRWHTSCYLAGYVVEAGLKAIAQADGMTEQQLSSRPYGHELRNLLPLVTAARLFVGYRGTPFDSARITGSQLYAQWNPNTRYQPTVWDNGVMSQDFQDTAEYVFVFLAELCLNGVI